MTTLDAEGESRLKHWINCCYPKDEQETVYNNLYSLILDSKDGRLLDNRSWPEVIHHLGLTLNRRRYIKCDIKDLLLI